MKKNCTLLFLICTITFAIPHITATTDTISLHYDTPEITITPSSATIKDIATINLKADAVLYPMKEGVPSVPYFSNAIIIPYGREIDTVLFLSNSSYEKKLGNPVSYVQAVWSSTKNRRETTIDSAAYTQKGLKPAAEIVSIQRHHGVQIVSIASYPVLLDGIRNNLTVHDSYTILVILKESNDRETILASPSKLSNTSYLNKNALATYTEHTRRSDDTYDWLMLSDIFVTTSAAAIKLTKHREAQGLRCKVVDVAGVGSTPKEIRAFIKEEYLNHGIKYVLLVGDETIIPPFRIDTYTAGGGIWDSITTDLPFQCLDDEDWEKKYYDEPYYGDYIAEVQIGRILANDIHEFSNQAEKVISYENLDTNNSALSRMLGVSQKLDETNWGKESIENVHAVIPDLLEKEFLSDKDSIWFDRDLYQKTNGNRFTIINHDGHASPKMIMKLTNAASLKNEVPLFLKSQGCRPAYFHQEDVTITEKLTLAPYGLFAATLNTNYGWYAGNGNGPSQKLHEFFWQGHFEEGIKTFSGMTEYSHRKCLEHKSFDVGFLWDMFSSNYFGDPATEYRSPQGAIPIAEKNPTTLHSSAQIRKKGSTIVVNVPASEVKRAALYSLQGRLITEFFIDPLQKQVSINLSQENIASGVYLFHLSSLQRNYSIPFIKR